MNRHAGQAWLQGVDERRLALNRWAAGALTTIVAAASWAQPLPTTGATQPATTLQAARVVPSVNGVIVQLHGAADNVPATLLHAPQRAKSSPVEPQHALDAARWKGVFSATAEHPSSSKLAHDLHAPDAMKPVGESAQLLMFSRRLTRPEAQAWVERLTAHPDVAWAAVNDREQRLQQGPGPGATNPPRDPAFGNQWWLQPVSGSNSHPIERRLRGVPGFQSAWLRHAGAAVVAVLDTGVTSHPELVGRLLPGYDFVSDWDATLGRGFANDGDGRDSDPSDPGDGITSNDLITDPARYKDCAPQLSSWHGTIIAGMLAGLTDNDAGVAAMQWNGRVVPVRVAGKCGADVADVIDGMRWAAGLPVAGVALNANPARIINMSFGGEAPCNAAYSQAIQQIKAAPGGGAVLVAAAGNGAAATVRPSNCPGAVGVVSLNRDGFKSTYSSFGSTVGVSTVGGDDGDGVWGAVMADSGLLSITNFGEYSPGQAGYERGFGTSFSAPVASGVAALMLSVNPALTVDQIIDGLRLTARPHVVSPHLSACSDLNPGRCACTTTTCGAGILDAEQAVLYAGDPRTYVKPATQAAVIDNAELRRAAALGPDRQPNTGAVAAVSTGGGASGWGWIVALLGIVLLLLAVDRPPPCFRPRTRRTSCRRRPYRLP